jgi:hypothetical protein
LQFEQAIVSAFNTFFLENKINALAYRRWAPPQVRLEFDVLVDSFNEAYYMAVECKSISASATKALYFGQHFSAPKGDHQLDREAAWLTKTGRIGFLAVETRYGKGNARKAYLVPFKRVLERFRSDYTGLPLKWLETQPQLTREGVKYLIDGRILSELVRD